MLVSFRRLAKSSATATKNYGCECTLHAYTGTRVDGRRDLSVGPLGSGGVSAIGIKGSIITRG